MNNILTYNSNSWIDKFFNDFDTTWVGHNHKKSFTPAVDVYEQPENFTLRMELPGVPKENLKIEVKENHLILSGKKENTSKWKDSEYHYSESRYGEFSRSFELPRSINSDDIQAEYTNGVLILNIPKSKDTVSRCIEIK